MNANEREGYCLRCGRSVPMGDIHTCQRCGDWLCEDCYGEVAEPTCHRCWVAEQEEKSLQG